jgi:hypothetical protein
MMMALGLRPGGRPLVEVCAFLGGAPGVLALDNLETPWEGDREGTDAMLTELAAVSGLVLVASVRGVERPAGVAWGSTIEVESLEEDAAAHLFCEISRARRDDPVLPTLLQHLEGVPLAITLLAHAAEGVNLAGVVHEWETKHTALLRKDGAKAGRGTSWAASMALSVNSPRMTDDAPRLLAVLGRLPDGIATGDVHVLWPERGRAAQRKLVQVGLAYEDEERLRLLAPVREHVREHLPPQRKDLARTMAHYGDMAVKLGPQVGHPGGATASAQLLAESANLDAMIREGLKGASATRWIEAALSLNHRAQFSNNIVLPADHAACWMTGAAPVVRRQT